MLIGKWKTCDTEGTASRSFFILDRVKIVLKKSWRTRGTTELLAAAAAADTMQRDGAAAAAYVDTLVLLQWLSQPQTAATPSSLCECFCRVLEQMSRGASRPCCLCLFLTVNGKYEWKRQWQESYICKCMCIYKCVKFVFALLLVTACPRSQKLAQEFCCNVIYFQKPHSASSPTCVHMRFPVTSVQLPTVIARPPND